MKLTRGRHWRAGAWLLFGLLVCACFTVIGWQYRAAVRQAQLNRSLLAAISSQQAVEVQNLLRDGANPNTRLLPDTPPPPPWQTLVATVRRLWQHQRPAPHPVYPTALLVAIGTETQANRSQEAIIQSLLDAGANPDTIGPMPDYSGTLDTPLLWALQSRQTKIVRLLLNNHANPRIPSDEGSPCLFYAVGSGSGGALALTSLLLNHGAEVNERNSDGETALMAAVDTAPDPALIKLLLDHGADVSARDTDGETALLYILSHNQLSDDPGTFQSVKLILDAGANVNATDKFGDSVLQMSVGTKAFPLLLSRGAKIFPPDDPHGAGLLIRACYAFKEGQQNYGNVKELLALGVGINATDKDGTPALVTVSGASDPKSDLLLLASGANVNARDRDGQTALMRAVTTGQIDTARVLLAHGADKALRDSKGRTALDQSRTNLFDARPPFYSSARGEQFYSPALGQQFVQLLSK